MEDCTVGLAPSTAGRPKVEHSSVRRPPSRVNVTPVVLVGRRPPGGVLQLRRPDLTVAPPASHVGHEVPIDTFDAARAVPLVDQGASTVVGQVVAAQIEGPYG